MKRLLPSRHYDRGWLPRGSRRDSSELALLRLETLDAIAEAEGLARKDAANLPLLFARAGDYTRMAFSLIEKPRLSWGLSRHSRSLTMVLVRVPSSCSFLMTVVRSA